MAGKITHAFFDKTGTLTRTRTLSLSLGLSLSLSLSLGLSPSLRLRLTRFSTTKWSGVSECYLKDACPSDKLRAMHRRTPHASSCLAAPQLPWHRSPPGPPGAGWRGCSGAGPLPAPQDAALY